MTIAIILVAWPALSLIAAIVIGRFIAVGARFDPRDDTPGESEPRSLSDSGETSFHIQGEYR